MAKSSFYCPIFILEGEQSVSVSNKRMIMKAMNNDPDMPEEYYILSSKRYAKGANLVLIDPDVAEFFLDHDSINDALRSLISC